MDDDEGDSEEQEPPESPLLTKRTRSVPARSATRNTSESIYSRPKPVLVPTRGKRGGRGGRSNASSKAGRRAARPYVKSHSFVLLSVFDGFLCRSWSVLLLLIPVWLFFRSPKGDATKPGLSSPSIFFSGAAPTLSVPLRELSSLAFAPSQSKQRVTVDLGLPRHFSQPVTVPPASATLAPRLGGVLSEAFAALCPGAGKNLVKRETKQQSDEDGVDAAPSSEVSLGFLAVSCRCSGARLGG
jgi:hypothetical protein